MNADGSDHVGPVDNIDAGFYREQVQHIPNIRILEIHRQRAFRQIQPPHADARRPGGNIPFVGSGDRGRILRAVLGQSDGHGTARLANQAQRDANSKHTGIKGFHHDVLPARPIIRVLSFLIL
jgi:hypothetical protein